MRLIRFGDGDTAYTFPTAQTQANPGFGEVVARTSPLLGMDGALDEDYGGRARAAIGDVGITWWMFGEGADVPGNLQDKIDMAYTMAEWGVQRLYIQPDNQVAGNTRYCYARLNNIRHNLNVAAMPHRRLQVQANFQVISPYWRQGGGVTGSVWDVALWGVSVWDGGIVTQALSGNVWQNFTVTTDGTAHTLPVIRLTATGGSVTSFVLERLVGGVTVDSVTMIGTLLIGAQFVVNAEAKTVTLGGSSAYNNLSTKLGRWLELAPGANALRAKLTGSETGTVAIEFENRWRVG